jgi:hypothetical protein
MTAYRFYNPAPVLMDLLGLRPCAGGSLAFYDKGTTTPRLTWSDQTLTIPNTNPVALDSSGRSNTNIWLSGAYSVVLKDATGAVVWTRDVDSGVDDGLTIPALSSGLFLSNDGSNLLWDSVRQVPDPSGSADRILGTDGTSLIWIAQQAIPASNASSGAGIMRIGDYAIQWGRSQCPATGLPSTATTVTIPTAYTETPFVLATVGTFPFYTPSWGGAGVIMARASSMNSIEIQMHGNAGTINSQTIVVAPIDFTWIAAGKVA